MMRQLFEAASRLGPIAPRSKNHRDDSRLSDDRSFTVRAAHEGDARATAACVSAAFSPYMERIGKPPAPMLSDYAALAAEERVWVAELSEQVVGLLA
jgi:hypothetical protein